MEQESESGVKSRAGTRARVRPNVRDRVSQRVKPGDGAGDEGQGSGERQEGKDQEQVREAGVRQKGRVQCSSQAGPTCADNFLSLSLGLNRKP